jgi:asparagine synthase (glutamine-hydrolysing)
MCRIAGIIDPTSPTEISESIVKQMCSLLQHGGPDDEGIFSSPGDHLVLGNRRLALLDLSSAGHQPMQYSSRYTITYNGELYNHHKLREELKGLGKVFTNHTDTEVVLAAFAQWGTQSFEKLNGMFAFGLWDNHEKELYLVRDAAGIKPLYYSTASGRLAFASEIRAFAPVPHLQEKNEQAPVFLLAYGHLPEPVTTLKDVQPLPKGCFLKYNTITAAAGIQSYKHYSYSSEITTVSNARNVVKTALHDAVQRQMTADAPLGVFLSGGIDSSVIALLADDKHRQLNTLSVYFNEASYSEKKYQDAVAKKMNADHHSFLITEKDFNESFDQIRAAMDLPSSDGINSWFISKHAAELGLKAVLSGIGGDELFGGYPSFSRMKTAQLLQHLPGAVLHAAGAAGNKLKRAAYLRLEGMKGIYLFLRGYFVPAEIAKQLDMDEKEVWKILRELPAGSYPENVDSGNAASYMEFNMYMQNQLLRDADVMSMAHGLEVRVPFLDDEVIRPLIAMEEKIKFSGPNPKQLMIDSFKDILPEEIWNRRKMGFSFPFAQWMKSNDAVQQLSGSSNKHVRNTVKGFMEGKVHWSKVMVLLMLNRD